MAVARRRTLSGDLYSGISGTVRRFPNALAVFLMVIFSGLSFSLPIESIWIPGLGLAAVALWFAKFAPARCLAENRSPKGTRCRNNSIGWLGGCRIQAHKQQSMFRRIKPSVSLPDPSVLGKLSNWSLFVFSALSGLGGLATMLAWAGYSLGQQTT